MSESNLPQPLRKYSEPMRRLATPFTEAELIKIDDWGFARRYRDRTAIIRELVKIGLEASENEKTD